MNLVCKLGAFEMGSISFIMKEEVTESGDIDFRNDKKFADIMKDSEAVSDFAKKKTLMEQRRFLPIFAVKNEVNLKICC